MRVLSDYKIQFEGLKQGTHLFEFEVDNKFFEAFDCFEFDESFFKIALNIEKRSTMMILNFNIEGKIIVPCDRCLDDVELPIKAKEQLIVKFGNESYSDTDDILILSESEHEINVASSIYEFIMLNTPQKRIHGKGKCNKAVIEELEKIEYKEEQDVDPRWETLKNIKIEK